MSTSTGMSMGTSLRVSMCMDMSVVKLRACLP